MKKTEEKDLTIKQRKWLKAYIKCGNATEAARLAGYGGDSGTLSNIGYENVRKLDFGDLMEEMGLTDVVLHNVLAEGLTKAVKVDITGDKHPDYATRHKYLDTALKIKKGNTEKQEAQPSVQINVHPEFLKKYGDI